MMLKKFVTYLVAGAKHKPHIYKPSVVTVKRSTYVFVLFLSVKLSKKV
jgi:hypothetical protein